MSGKHGRSNKMAMNQRSPSRIGHPASIVLFLARVVLGCVFAWSSIGKIYQPYDFLVNVYDYDLVGPQAGLVVAVVLPWFELCVGIGLLGGVCIGGSLLLGALMGGMFVLAQASVISRSLVIDCGCFGGLTGEETVGYGTLFRSVAFSAIALAGYIAWSVRPIDRDTEAEYPV